MGRSVGVPRACLAPKVMSKQPSASPQAKDECRAFDAKPYDASLWVRGDPAVAGPWLQQIQLRRSPRRPGIFLEIDRNDRVPVTHQKFAQHRQIERAIFIWNCLLYTSPSPRDS